MDSAAVREPATKRATVPDVASGPTSPIDGRNRRGYILRRLFVLADLVALACAGIIAGGVALLAGRTVSPLDLTIFLVFLPLWVPIAVGFRAYHPHAAGRTTTVGDELGPVLRVATVWSWFLLLARAAVHTGGVQLLPSVVLWMAAIPVVLASRSLTRRIAGSRAWYRQRALVVGGAGDRARIVERIRRHPEWGIDVVGVFDSVPGVSLAGEPLDGDPGLSPGGGAGREPGPAAYGSMQTRPEVAGRALVDEAHELRASRVILATAPEQLDARTGLSRALTEAGVQVDLVPGDSEILSSSAELGQLEGLPIISMPPTQVPRSLSVLKRFFDLLIGVPALVVAAPVIAYCAVRIKLDSPGPVFFRQVRAGRAGRRFVFLKLRTMDADADERLSEVAELNMHGTGLRQGAFKAVDDPRVTRVGAWLRRRSLDELPQLWNVVKGEMSLVGPRPVPVREDARITGHYEVRREVRPGVTGPWQVLGRSDIPFDDMLRLDYSYVMNWSLVEDFRLLSATASAVIRARGAY